jgi:hypothetical protein
MERRNRRRLLALVFGWAAPVGVGTVAGVVARLPSTIPTVEVVAVVISMVAFVVPVLVSAGLAILDSPGMTERLCRVIDSLRGRPPESGTGRRNGRPRPKGKDPTGR